MRRVGLNDVGDHRTAATRDATNQLSHDYDESTAAVLAMLIHHYDEVLKTDPTCGTCNRAAMRAAPTELLTTTSNANHDTDAMLGCDDLDAWLARPSNRPTHSWKRLFDSLLLQRAAREAWTRCTQRNDGQETI